jgi:hypothetical protein
MDFHKIWQEQCEATRTIRERFGVKNALDYLVGEKLLTFARAADEDSEFAAELPRFQAAVWEIFNPYELRGYVASLKPAARKKLQKLLTFLRKRLRLSRKRSFVVVPLPSTQDAIGDASFSAAC